VTRYTLSPEAKEDLDEIQSYLKAAAALPDMY
jgi:plasmid stabilization system protein ParE